MTEQLTKDQRTTMLAPLLAQGWAMADGRDAMTKRFHFEDFNAAFGWMTRAAMIAEVMNHHPEWSNVYNRVEVTLTTHDAGGLSQLDVQMAQALDGLSA